ncbi:hypothetical protein ACWELB_21145 [Streptomyces asiaticus]
MAAKTYISFRTVGGHTVDLRYEPLPQDPGDPPDGVYADCRGCPGKHGPGSEGRARDWALAHAKTCNPHT